MEILAILPLSIISAGDDTTKSKSGHQFRPVQDISSLILVELPVHDRR